MKDINIEDLKVAQRRASKDSIRVTKALGLPYYTVRKGYLYLIEPNGKEKKIRKAIFGTRKINTRRIALKDGQ